MGMGMGMGDVGESKTSDVEIGVRAEGAIDKILSKVHPTAFSEQRRKAVILYVQRLIKRNLGCEVFPYGSVPLKTYLPDGDIDLTAFVDPGLEESLANDVVSVLQAEEQSDVAEFIVKDVQLIRAEVKIVKCIVQNIVVDISFNQLGGLCTLCFLEQVNRRIGKDHLFKRSIILIKSWCYYESRILGAHHALISTYALETLVLYIFHLFHSELHGPLAVLYRYLEYFSKFDWDSYCISLHGPVKISSLPEIEEMKIGNGDRGLLLSDEFLRDCENMFSVPPRGFNKKFGTFTPKHLNIIDPLKADNNLGRSVSKGNLFRIRSAFAYGARKLGQAFSQEEVNINEELSKFFSNTLDRHGSGQRPDVQDLCGGHSTREFSFSETESYKSASAANSVSANKICERESGDGDDVLYERVFCREIDGGLVIGSPANRNAENLATSKLQFLKIANDVPEPKKASPISAPHLFFQGSKSRENSSEKSSSGDPNENLNLVTNQQATKDLAFCEQSLPDLNGDYESHFNSLLFGRYCYENSLAMAAHLPPPLPSQWDGVRHGYPHKRNGFGNGHLNNVGMIPRPSFYPNNGMMLRPPPGMPPFVIEDSPKQRGTGTYFPKANCPPYRNHMMGRGGMSEHGPMHSPRHSPRQTLRTPFSKIDDSFIVNSLDVSESRNTSGFGVNDLPPVAEKSRTTGQQKIPSFLIPSPPPPSPPLPPPPPPSSSPKELQSSTPEVPASSKDTRLLRARSLYHLKNEDDFPPLSM